MLRLLGELRERLSLSIVFITHDLRASPRRCATSLPVMKDGEVVSGPIADVFARPQHPYTQALLSSIPGRAFGLSREAASRISRRLIVLYRSLYHCPTFRSSFSYGAVPGFLIAPPCESDPIARCHPARHRPEFFASAVLRFAASGCEERAMTLDFTLAAFVTAALLCLPDLRPAAPGTVLARRFTAMTLDRLAPDRPLSARSSSRCQAGSAPT